MTVALQMLGTNPGDTGYSPEALATCIDACFDCAQACTACADACLGEDMVADMGRCITADLNCADVCGAAGRVLSRQSAYSPELTTAVVEACRRACAICAEVCEGHAQMDHCKVCAEACRRCEAACGALLAA